MSVPQVKIGNVSISRLIIGGNPFSGFSHQTPQRDKEMRHHYTTEQVKAALREAEQIGVNTHLGRADHHVMRILLEYWDQGGTIQWIAQTCPEIGSPERGVDNGINGGAKACFLHGGYMDMLQQQNRLGEVPALLARIKAAGLPAGVAGHNTRIFQYAEEHFDCDFYMCSYYDPIPRTPRGEHIVGAGEVFDPGHRQSMVEQIQTLKRPVIHYKVLAAGRTPPAEALDFVARYLRPQDAVCVGICTKDKPGMLAEDIRLLADGLRKAEKAL